MRFSLGRSEIISIPSVLNLMSTLKKLYNLKKVDFHKLITLNDQNKWSEIDLGNINKRYVE